MTRRTLLPGWLAGLVNILLILALCAGVATFWENVVLPSAAQLGAAYRAHQAAAASHAPVVTSVEVTLDDGRVVRLAPAVRP